MTLGPTHMKTDETLTFTLTVSGMDCADCARTVQSGVLQLDGVESCAVSFATERAQIVGRVDRDAVVHRVRELGYDVVETAASAPQTPDAPRNFVAYLWQRADTRAALLAAVLIVPAVILSELAGVRHLLLDLAAVAAMVLAGWPIARSGWHNLRINHTLNINALMTIAAVGAVAIGAYTEAGMVMVLFAIGEALEGYTAGRARRALRSFTGLMPRDATRVDEHGVTTIVPVDALAPGDRILVKPGDRIPLDGRVVEGVSGVNQAAITGESMPVGKEPGDELLAGTVNGDGALEVVVTSTVEDNTFSRIVALVREAQEAQAPTQRTIDRFAAVYTPAVVLLALLVATIPPLVWGAPFLNPPEGGFGWLYRALALLVVACPCALVISTPVAIISAISNAARRGMLIKGGAILERLPTIKVLAFDKTGTLTQGRPQVVAVRTPGCADDAGCDAMQACAACAETLTLAAALEARSEHPLAQAIVSAADDQGFDPRRHQVSGVRALGGRGIHGTVDGHAVVVASHAHFDDAVPHDAAHCRQAQDDAAQGRTPVLVSVDGGYRGTIALMDTVRPTAAAAVDALRAGGMAHIAMLTGDHAAAAGAMAAQTGVTDVRAGLLPADKTAAVDALRAAYGPIAMVGDGINDAPALARADVGIALGTAHTGTAQAMETADVSIMSDDLGRLPFLFALARAALRTIHTNIAVSIGIKLVFILLVVAGRGTMWMAVLADVGTSLLVTLYGMRLLGWNNRGRGDVVNAP